ncbi:hypothetical protein OIU77_025172 [Salix suchowensis]|uniref:Uncharacterized protein n=1 Tax=Salix suchowensis TaxID=1278906 RepID=A0ABQ9BVC5_9ROSI|nr:hypothetical protein OIU77_025172 [Salix suchowensis]
MNLQNVAMAVEQKRKTIKSSAKVVFASPKGVAGGSQPEEFIENDTDAIPGGQPNDSRVTGKKICRGIKSNEATEEDVVGGFQQVECSYNDFDTITPLNQPTREEIETEPGQPVDTDAPPCEERKESNRAGEKECNAIGCKSRNREWFPYTHEAYTCV